MTHPLQWKKYPVLNDGYICLVDHMGDDSSIVQAARVSYGNDDEDSLLEKFCGGDDKNNLPCELCHGSGIYEIPMSNKHEECPNFLRKKKEQQTKDRNLIRYMMSHGHTTPFEMVVIKFKVRVPMDCWRQWIRHRTASVNEYSTRYSEAIDSQQTTSPEEWRLQATNNKQGSSGFLEEGILNPTVTDKPRSGQDLTRDEEIYHHRAWKLYQNRLALGIAKEQARKDLPLSTYTEAYWCCDLHNIFNFLRQRMDSHAQLEIRSYANAMAEIVKQIVPVAWEAFEDYQLHAKRFSRMEMEILINHLSCDFFFDDGAKKLSGMSDREWNELKAKLDFND